jgi:death on curing protein
MIALYRYLDIEVSSCRDTLPWMEPLRLEDLLLLAEDVLGHPAERLLRVIDVGSAESALAAPFAGFGDREFYEGVALRAAILASRLVRNHPFPDGNKRVALVAMIEFVRRNNGAWPRRIDQDEVAETFERLAARDLDEPEFASWVASKLG